MADELRVMPTFSVRLTSREWDAVLSVLDRVDQESLSEEEEGAVFALARGIGHGADELLKLLAAMREGRVDQSILKVVK